MAAPRKKWLVAFGALVVVVYIGWWIVSEVTKDTANRRPIYFPPAEPQEIASALGLDAEALAPPPIDPPAPAGDLVQEAARFTSIDACVAERAKIDPLIGDSLHAMGYDTFLRDSCRTLEALHDKKKERCAPIESTPLRAHCETTVAIALALPSDCPLVSPAHPDEGHEPACIAYAARDPRLCVALPSPEKTRCEAVLAQSARNCPRASAESAACVREVARLGPLVTDVKPAPPLPPARAAIGLHGANGTEDPAPSAADSSFEVARGVVVTKTRLQSSFTIGTLERSDFAPPSQYLRASVKLRVPASGPVEVERFELDIPNAARVYYPSQRALIEAKLEAFEAKRGAPLDLSIKGQVTVGLKTYDVTYEVHTFVRDVSDVP